MLIGSGPTLSIRCPGQLKVLNDNNLIFQKTKLGWIMGGNLESTNLSKSSRCLVTSLPFDLERFWKLEDLLIQGLSIPVRLSSTTYRCGSEMVVPRTHLSLRGLPKIQYFIFTTRLLAKGIN
ncbi:hypothetical protein TSAR_004062 [Trichomalopsis sarcophagae]|uniref:Peptidase aspartic putative domain-containing protein n=1 Tax=Trichomalopsis sarcophagae TaxID=543379 RepID=A0A232F0I6_9HYME|nr:hypothetical protein TSAR_004062 [Trichomalopsis sarcophagae]